MLDTALRGYPPGGTLVVSCLFVTICGILSSQSRPNKRVTGKVFFLNELGPNFIGWALADCLSLQGVRGVLCWIYFYCNEADGTNPPTFRKNRIDYKAIFLCCLQRDNRH